MAEYCPRCGRGSWACGCFISFKDKIGSVQAKTTTSAEPEEPEPTKHYAEAPSPEQMLAGDERRATILEYRDRYPKPYEDPPPRDNMARV